MARMHKEEARAVSTTMLGSKGHQLSAGGVLGARRLIDAGPRHVLTHIHTCGQEAEATPLHTIELTHCTCKLNN